MPKAQEDHASWMERIARPLLERLPSLYPVDNWDSTLDEQIDGLLLKQLTAGKIEQKPYGLAIKAGLHLLNESLDKSHAIAQEITNGTGSYWHGLMHRMEGDYRNAKYWFAETGQHPIYPLLIIRVREYLSDKAVLEFDHDALRSKLNVLATAPMWNPSVFVDAVEIQVTFAQHPLIEEWLKHIQGLEMNLLLQYCYEQSCGGRLLEAIRLQ